MLVKVPVIRQISQMIIRAFMVRHLAKVVFTMKLLLKIVFIKSLRERMDIIMNRPEKVGTITKISNRSRLMLHSA